MQIKRMDVAALALIATLDCQSPPATEMILVPGDTFEMGDVFDEGVRLASPVHEVTLSNFQLGKFEVTVEEFAAFVEDRGYVTSAEDASRIAAKSGKRPGPSTAEEYEARLSGPGTHVLNSATGRYWMDSACWRKPQFEQGPRDPVVAVSWIDAVSYCNWLSGKADPPVAYHLETGGLLDSQGKPTTDVPRVRGYRLPTEAEWEYAAREGGMLVRFGNGQDTTRSAEINFNAAIGNFAYGETGEFRGKTMPVGSLKPNSLGLHDMSGNVWEWCSDFVDTYPAEPQTNPYQSAGDHDRRRVARGGPWVGDASLARVSVRLGWVANDRCNNIGFRLARSR